MMWRSKKRGSAMIMVIFVATAVGVVALAGIGVTGAISSNQSKLEKAQELKYVVAGACELAGADLAAGILTPGDTKVYYVGGNAITVTAATNPNLANSATLTLSGTSQGIPISSVQNVSYLPAVVDNIWSYGIFSNGGFTWPLASSSIVGSAYFKSSISILGTGQISKDFKTSSSFNPLSLLTIGGAILTGINVKTFPAVSNTTYTSSADAVLAGNQTLNGYTMPVANALVVVTGTLSIKGTINGDGTIYATGAVTVNGNLTKQSGGRHILIVTPGNITFKNPAGMTLTADGYYYAGGTIAIQSTLTTSGGLVGNAYSVSSGFTVNWDPWINQATGNGPLLHAPGLWP